MEPLDAHQPPAPDAITELHGEIDQLARVGLASADALMRSRCKKDEREARAIAALATAEMGGAAADLERAQAASATPGLAASTADEAAGLLAETEGGAADISAVGADGTLDDISAAGEAGQATEQAATVLAGNSGPVSLAELLEKSFPGVPVPEGDTTASLAPGAEVPVTLAELLDASYPVSIADALATAQLAVGTSELTVAPLAGTDLARTNDLGR